MDSTRHPVIVVIPGNFIAEEYIPNTCVALAKAGYVGIAPNIDHPIPPEIRPDDASPELKAAFGARTLGDMEIIEAAIGWPRSTAFGDPARATFAIASSSRRGITMGERHQGLSRRH